MKLLFLIPIFLTLIQCATTKPAPTPMNNESAGLAMEVTLKLPLMSKTPEVIYFLKVDPKKPLTSSNEVVVSNYAIEERVYYLNAPVGTYVPIAATYTNKVTPFGAAPSSSSTKAGSGTVTVTYTPKDTDALFFFPEEIAKIATIQVEKGKLNYAGNFVLETSTDLGKADSLQKHTANLIKPGALEQSTLKSMAAGSYVYLLEVQSHKKDEASKSQFKEKSSAKELKNNKWLDLL
ncbi:MAG: hypothetical protein N3A69_00640 [Leptospiraceae bacterium]|nr:hypothetical protein [Leptospiraceae bacterium]